MTVYKAIKPQAETAATLAVARHKGEDRPQSDVDQRRRRTTEREGAGGDR